jgi:hypothetical protein
LQPLSYVKALPGPQSQHRQSPFRSTKSGEAKIHAKVELSSGSTGPIILLRERYEGKIGGWLAATGF